MQLYSYFLIILHFFAFVKRFRKRILHFSAKKENIAGIHKQTGKFMYFFVKFSLTKKDCKKLSYIRYGYPSSIPRMDSPYLLYLFSYSLFREILLFVRHEIRISGCKTMLCFVQTTDFCFYTGSQDSCLLQDQEED